MIAATVANIAAHVLICEKTLAVAIAQFNAAVSDYAANPTKRLVVECLAISAHGVTKAAWELTTARRALQCEVDARQLEETRGRQ